MKRFALWFIIACLSLSFHAVFPELLHAQLDIPTEIEDTSAETQDEEPFDEGLFPELPTPGEEGKAPEAVEETPPGEDLPTRLPAAKPASPSERIEGGEAREGEARWFVQITGAVLMNYIFSDTTEGFQVKYRWEVKGQANAEAALIRGDALIVAEVEGPLLKWPTGECRLDISIPKIPFELQFRKTGEEKGSLKLTFKRPITEDWESRCSFADAPDRRFDTRGTPEAWLTKALEKAKPPLKDIIADMGDEETTTRFLIPKESIPDPPLGAVEIEGTGVVTIRPGGE